MTAASASRAGPARVPWFLAKPFSLLPGELHGRLLVTALNYTLAVALYDGELDFLHNRAVVIKVRDIEISYRFSLRARRLVADRLPRDDSLIIEASLYDFLLLIGRQEDPDTLVFQRRLVVRGDTELGLQVKNFLDALDVESLQRYRSPAALLRRALPVYARLFG